MQQTHYLKTWREYFAAVQRGDKTFEVRKNDRNFQVGDIVILQEHNEVAGKLTGREIRVVITYILKSFSALPEDYCVFAFKPRLAL